MTTSISKTRTPSDAGLAKRTLAFAVAGVAAVAGVSAAAAQEVPLGL